MAHLTQSNLTQGKLLQMIKKKRWSEAIGKLKHGFFGPLDCKYQDLSSLKFPLHLASSAFDAPPDLLRVLISLLLQAQLSIAEAQDKQGYSPLHLACVFGLDVSCISLLVEANRSSCDLFTKKGDTPLSLACQRSKTSYETIALLLNNSSHSASLKNNMGWLPLHGAVWHNISRHSLKAIIESFPEAVFCRTYSSDHTPLSLFWSNHSACTLSEDEWSTVSILLGPNESSKGGLLHKILSFPQHLPGLVQSLLLSFPDEAKSLDEFGRLPLHRIIENTHFPASDIQQVLSVYPEAAGKIDPLTGDIPLQAAITNSVRCLTWRTIPKQIFHQFPDAIYFCSKRNQLYPFMLAAAYSALDICFELLRSAPELVYP